MKVETKIVDFISKLQHDIEVLIGEVSTARSERRLREMLDVGFPRVMSNVVVDQRLIRAAHPRPGIKPARRKYARSPKWYAAQKARRKVARKGKVGKK